MNLSQRLRVDNQPPDGVNYTSLKKRGDMDITGRNVIRHDSAACARYGQRVANTTVTDKVTPLSRESFEEKIDDQ